MQNNQTESNVNGILTSLPLQITHFQIIILCVTSEETVQWGWSTASEFEEGSEGHVRSNNKPLQMVLIICPSWAAAFSFLHWSCTCPVWCATKNQQPGTHCRCLSVHAHHSPESGESSCLSKFTVNLSSSHSSPVLHSLCNWSLWHEKTLYSDNACASHRSTSFSSSSSCMSWDICKRAVKCSCCSLWAIGHSYATIFSLSWLTWSIAYLGSRLLMLATHIGLRIFCPGLFPYTLP